MLYAPELHTRLTDTPWNIGDVRDAVATVVAQADQAYDAQSMWPAHEWDGWQAALPLKNVYVGAAGVVWALDRLRREGFESTLDLKAVARQALDRFRDEPDYQAGETSEYRRFSLLCGETGIAFVTWRLEHDDEIADDLLELIRANIGNDANEVMFGAPGTLLAARWMHAATAEPRWAEAVAESEQAVRAARRDDGLWTQNLWGRSFESLSPPHGLVGNVIAVEDLGNAPDVLRERATVESGRANWSTSEPKLQWCDGGAGIVVHAAPYLDEDLLLAAAELVWDAGPVADEKGAGICHGTAGNGYALLKTFERTGEERWLERARAFAVHALEQTAALPGRYSLFTGGVGAALFACDCLAAEARYPLLDGAGT